MKVDLSKGFLSFDKEPLKDEKGQLFTLGKVIATSLSTPLEEDRGLDQAKVLERWKLALRMWDCGEQELTPEEATTIRQRIFKTSPLIIAGQVIESLNG